MTAPGNTPEFERTLAAEYVLGLLDPQAQAEAERRLAHDPAFAREVEHGARALRRSTRRRMPCARRGSVVADRKRHRGAADSERHRTRHAARGSGTALAHCAPPRSRARSPRSLLAVVSIGSLQYARQEAARKPIYVAVLVSDPSKEPGAVVNAFADGRVEMIPLTEINVPEGRALEIWTLWDRQVGPRSVGLLQRARATQLNLDNLPRTGENQLFEITLEPATGSPTGRPTGPVLFKGTTSRAL